MVQCTKDHGNPISEEEMENSNCLVRNKNLYLAGDILEGNFQDDKYTDKRGHEHEVPRQ